MYYYHTIHALILLPHTIHTTPSGRDGMAGLIEALAAIDIVCVEQTAAPDYM